ncbi:MAG: hypothetical protein JAZ03_13555, partial [Candidatus Thiodiazotropha taylori]|nr:hypothetical protein [Candidatus Thiodiazotropha taylori]MCW4334960.1 hypothetical protein [Candidatus Thiodiazotropha endolucinida]
RRKLWRKNAFLNKPIAILDFKLKSPIRTSIFVVLKQLRVGFYQTFKRLRINTANIHDIFKCECFQHYDFGLTGNIGFSILFYRFEIHLHLWDKGYRVFQTWPIGLQET